MLKEYSVLVTLKENSRVRLHPSYAFAGIQKGDVQVIGIYESLDIDQIKPLREAQQEFVNGVLGTTPYDQADAIDRELVDSYNSCNWVGYVYTRNQQEGVMYLPIETFIDHMTCC